MHLYKVPLYGANVMFTRSRKEFSKKAGELGAYEDTENMEGAVLETDAGNYLMGVFTRDPNVMAHECSHLALSIIKNAGFDAEAGNPEPFCYLLGHLVGYFSKVK
jgi:hypothetical protein